MKKNTKKNNKVLQKFIETQYSVIIKRKFKVYIVLDRSTKAAFFMADSLETIYQFLENKAIEEENKIKNATQIQNKKNSQTPSLKNIDSLQKEKTDIIAILLAMLSNNTQNNSDSDDFFDWSVDD